MAKARPSRKKAAAPAAAPAARASGSGIKVRAKEMGYYDDKRRRPGDVFTIRSEQEWGDWMERVHPLTPEKITTGAQALQQSHDAELAARNPPGMATGRDDVPADVPTGTRNPLGD